MAWAVQIERQEDQYDEPGWLVKDVNYDVRIGFFPDSWFSGVYSSEEVAEYVAWCIRNYNANKSKLSER